MNENIEFKLKHLTDSPGCYMMKSKGEIIYVGKAKNLKNRVRQYFHPSKDHTPKVRAMVEHIDDFETVLVDSEIEALMLECNLIKLHKPHYNILLKDDKHYPYLAIDMREDFPTIRVCRKQEKDGMKYFGPFPGVHVAMDLVRSVFPVRRCNGDIKPDPKARGCMYRETGQCCAPCKGLVTREEYHQMMKQVMSFLSGKNDEVIDDLKAQMQKASMEMRFEQAAVLRDRIRDVEQVLIKQKAIVTSGGDMDVVAMKPEDTDALVQMLYIRGGKLIGSEHFELSMMGEEPADSVLMSFLLQWYGDSGDIPPMILVQNEPEDKETLEMLLGEVRSHKVEIHVPQRGDKKRLLDMACKNVSDIAEKRAMKLQKSYRRTTGALEELAQVLGLESIPRRIEGYDISNTQGAQSVAAMVVMLDGVIAPKQYRHFRIKTVIGPNDFASMHEVITRRFKHGLEEKAKLESEGRDVRGGSFSDLPDLILIDGGRGQLNEAQNAMHDAGLDIPMFGLAERLEEIVLPGEYETLLLDRHSEALHLIQRLRDEAHRFGITHHRKLRAKASIHSKLDGIPGIGPKKKQALMKRFKTVEAIRAASVQELCQAEGISDVLADVVYKHFHS